MANGAQVDRPVDGRRARRERGRLAVIDATIDLVLLGGGPPSADQVAERAGVSEASLFRYFDTLDDLRHQAIGRYLERHDHLMEVPDIGEHALDRRVRDLVAARLRYYETVQPMATLARRQAPEVPEVAATLARVRATLADQVAQHFEPELRSFRPGPRAERVAVLAALTSFESWQLLGEQGLDAAGIGRAWRRSLTDLLANRR